MRVIVHGKNTHVPRKLKDHATTKLEKVERFSDRIQTLEIEFSEEHNPRQADNRFTVEVIATTKKRVLRAHASGPDAMSAVDAVEDKLEAQVKRMKSRFTRRGSRARKGGLNDRRTPPLPSLDELPTPDARNRADAPISSSEFEKAEEGSGITKVTRFAVKPMTADEAVLQLRSLDRDFYLFHNAESDQSGVVYKRSDGSFGLIEPE